MELCGIDHVCLGAVRDSLVDMTSKGGHIECIVWYAGVTVTLHNHDIYYNMKIVL